MLKFLVPVDGSDSSLRAVEQLSGKLGWFKEPVEIYLLNVQPPVPYGGRVSSVVGRDKLDQYHKEEGMAALKPAMQKLDAARLKYHHHILVGDGMRCHDPRAFPAAQSDHLALAIELEVPERALR